MVWSSDMDEVGERMWAAGDSGREIGKALGVSRNAVIGRAHRKGWLRPGSARPPHVALVACVVKASRKKVSIPRPHRARKPAAGHRNAEAHDHVAGGGLPMPLPDDWPITILTVTSGACKFPLADRWPWPLCGEPSVGPAPYCADHCSICYGARR